MIIPRLDETVEQGGQAVLLSGAEYADGRIECDGIRHLKHICREWQAPVWTFDVGGTVFEKRIVSPHGQNTIYIEYRCLNGSMRLHLRPYITYRMHDARLGEGRAEVFPLTLSSGRYEVALPHGVPTLKLCVRPRQGVFVADEVVSEEVSYGVDRDRGSAHIQDLFSPGYFTVDLSGGHSVALVASVEPWEMLDFDCQDILQAEGRRLEKLVSLAPALQKEDFGQQLQLAADQFVVRPGARPEEQALAEASGDEARTIIAGYHWFGDWGRDTMISLAGLTLATNRPEIARGILLEFAKHISMGMLPNRFPDAGGDAEYNTVDASLWYFEAVRAYAEATGDHILVRDQIYPHLVEMLLWHVKGTRYGIGVDAADGLLSAGEPGVQLTWMDAKIGDLVITPRIGKPVAQPFLERSGPGQSVYWPFEFAEKSMYMPRLAKRGTSLR